MVRKSLESRLGDFNKVHGGRYDYSLVPSDIKWNSKIPVVCPSHGVFETIVNNHQRGSGCPKCAGVNHLTRDERIQQAVTIHGDKYDYSLWPLQLSSSSKVTSLCPKHGKFVHTVANHVNHKSGCPKCAGNVTRDWETFVAKANRVHNGKYRYKFAHSVTNNDTVTICCPTHGDFEQLVSNHLSGKGCTGCATNGYRHDKRGTLYGLISQDGAYFKVGITNNLDQRMTSLRSGTPFGWSLVKVVASDDGEIIRKLETMIQSEFTSANLAGFDGATEWLLYDCRIETWFDILGA